MQTTKITSALIILFVISNTSNSCTKTIACTGCYTIDPPPHYKLNQFDTVDKVFLSWNSLQSPELFEISFTKTAYNYGNAYDSAVCSWTTYKASDGHPYNLQYLVNSPPIILDSLTSNVDGYFSFSVSQSLINKPFMQALDGEDDSLFITFILSPGAQIAIPSVSYGIPVLDDTTEVPIFNSFMNSNYLNPTAWAFYPSL